MENEFTGRDEAHQIAMASRELMENACKYSIQKPSMIILSVDKKRTFVVINVRNTTTLDHINDFIEVHNEIKTGEPDEAYQKAALRTIDEEGPSRLGIARIRYELKTIVSYRVMKSADSLEKPENDIRKLSVYLKLPISGKAEKPLRKCEGREICRWISL
jgi:hypothetical protein